MTTKLYDVVVKTGSYTNNQNEQKNRYENIGVMMQGDNGPYLLLKTTFNPAGVTNPDNRDTVLCSLFEQKDQNQPQTQQGYGQPQQGSTQQPQQQAPIQQHQQSQQNNYAQTQSGMPVQGFRQPR